MQSAMLKWNGVPTQVIAEGRWVEEGFSPDGKKDVVVVVTGNPGIPGFYEGFVKSLKLRLPTEVPVWVVGHGGHVQPPSNLSVTMPKDSTWNEHYSLMAQLEHKKEFIKKYVPEGAKLHLVGHSIGSWMILNLLKDDSIAKKVVKCYLLFPTIEQMAKSPNGWYFTKIVSQFQVFLLFLCWILFCLPPFLQYLLISIFAPIYGVPAKYNKAVLQFLNPHSLKKVIKMAEEEMEIVKGRDDDTITKHSNKLWFYYGNCDGWVPIKYYNSLKSAHPYINAQLCKNGYRHSFVLKYDKQMGKTVGDIINENIL